nr:amino acid permease [Halothiobacillus sp.]
AAIFVVFVYVAVTLGATMLAGALTMVEQKQVALSVAATRAAGLPGLVVMTVAAGFATAAAINSTLYSTGKLAARVAQAGELPQWFDHQNHFDVPDRPMILVGVIATALAIIGSLSSLVEASSLVFLGTFTVVNLICWKQMKTTRWVPMAGVVLGVLVAIVLVLRLMVIAPVPLAMLIVLALLIFIGRPALLKRMSTEGPDQGDTQ